MKRYRNASILYAILAMAGGVFYREFTKFNHFTGKSTLSVVHTHYFLLGMLFFLMLLLLEKSFSFTRPKTARMIFSIFSFSLYVGMITILSLIMF